MIQKILLKEIDINDEFFNSLKQDYYNFSNWFKKQQDNNNYGYVTFNNNKLSSLLILKIEEETNDLKYSISNKKRLKISTFKVNNTKTGIGEEYLNIIYDYARKNEIDEIYTTMFPKHKELIDKLTKHGFILKNYKQTKISANEYQEEHVYFKEMGKILLSIKPIYVNQILNGTKKYEYRKIKPKRNDIGKLIIYSTTPIKKVVAQVNILEYINEDKNLLWNKTKEVSGINKAFYDEYYQKTSNAFCFKLGKITKYDKPKELSDFKVNMAPQSYIYIK